MSVTTDLTSGRLLARNTILNLVGEALPFLVGLFAIPVLIHGIGVDRYGILTLAALVVGYFGLFDFGLGAAATKLIAEAVGAGDRQAIPGLFWTSLLLMFAFGTCGAILVAALSPWFVAHLFRISPALHTDTVRAFYLLALSLPFVISAGSLRGTLAAFQRFDLINAVRVPTGVLSYLGPLLVLPFSQRLGLLVGVMVAIRLAAWLASLLLCLRITPELRANWRLSRQTMGPMLRFGGWVTLSNVVGPIMVYFDRFLISTVISTAALAYYSVPYQVTTKLWIIPGALEAVMFPAFSGTVERDVERTAHLFQRATLLLLFALFPLVLVIVAFAPVGLTLWLGPDFARHSTVVIRWLAIGVFVNSMAYVPASLIIAVRRPDLTAKLHIAEVPLYCLLLWWLVRQYGIDGAAIAWTIRVAADAVALFVTTRLLLPQTAAAIDRTAVISCFALLVLGIACTMVTPMAAELYVGVSMAVVVAGSWGRILDSSEKDLVRRAVRRLWSVPAGVLR